jgi:NAD(P)-dependent dehydrogenase (short-subunit alcohol dehydrogenase family)
MGNERSAPLAAKVCIVTGGNTGIGKETARGLLALGFTVVMACRDKAKAETARSELLSSTPEAKERLTVMELDLGNLQSIGAFVKTFRAAFERLDLLVNNAGVWTTSRSITANGFETTFGVNHLGTHLLTRELLPMLEASAPSRIVVLSSALHYRGVMLWDDLQHASKKFNGPAAYNQSKLANVLFTCALARRLKNKGVTVNAVHPGVVATELARAYPKLLVKLFHLFLLTPAQGAACSLYVATSPELEGVTGKYFEKSKEKPAAKAALDKAAQERLWKLTEDLIATTLNP